MGKGKHKPWTAIRGRMSAGKDKNGYRVFEVVFIDMDGNCIVEHFKTRSLRGAAVAAVNYANEDYLKDKRLIAIHIV